MMMYIPSGRLDASALAFLRLHNPFYDALMYRWAGVANARVRQLLYDFIQ